MKKKFRAKNHRSSDLSIVTLFTPSLLGLTHKTIIFRCFAAMCALNHLKNFRSSERKLKRNIIKKKCSDKWVTGQDLIVEAPHERGKSDEFSVVIIIISWFHACLINSLPMICKNTSQRRLFPLFIAPCDHRSIISTQNV
jgi:hypothetical protein